MPESATDNVLQHASALLGLQADVRQAADRVALAACAREIRPHIVQLHADGASAAWVTQAFSLLNDEIARRAAQLLLPHFSLPAAPWCWLGLGSEGRLEQTLATDQDNGLIFSASDDAEALSLQPLFLPFATAMNETLAECGIPLCEGNIMGGNPSWCLSLSQWKENFARWVRTPEPEALLNAAIFFDFRPLTGDAALAAALRDYLTPLVSGNEIFARMMARNALAASPPLGRLRDFVFEGRDPAIDLKKFGSRIFVDAARVLALCAGVDATGTVARMHGVVAKGLLSERDAAAAVAAFHALQGLRISVQTQAIRDSDRGNDGGDNNRTRPDQLNDFERGFLLEALRQARSLQQSLKSRFSINE